MYTATISLIVDWVIAEVLCVKQGGHGGRTRYILKDALKFVPMYGWMLGEVRHRSVQSLASLVHSTLATAFELE